MRNLTNPYGEHKLMRMDQARGYRSGNALHRHIMSAHDGVVSESCPACKEIQRKTEQAKGSR
jgi:hypothetical protein